jgi:hypothetical protein
MTRPPANVLELPLEVRAEMAMKQAVEEVIIDRARRGLSIHIMRDGKIIELSGKELQAEADRILAE